MKKIIALILVLMLGLFAGCTSENTAKEKEERKEKQETAKEPLQSALKDDKEKEDEAEKSKYQLEEPVRVQIDTSWFDLIGKTNDTIAYIKGEMSENLWADGPLYRFGPENVWYAFENYDIARDNSYIPIGQCTSIGVPLDMLLINEEICDADSLEEAAHRNLVEGFDIMYETNTYSVDYNEYRLVIYESSEESISGDSMVNIEKE